ncbi:MAG: type II secretion system protein GspL [Pseudomonadales bacterium]|nr:type II secretion system protein GspL [Pseudomonadales bacterium]
MPKLFIRLRSPATASEEGGYDVLSAWMIIDDADAVRAHGETDFRGLSDLIDPNAAWLKDPANVIVTVPSEYVLGITCDVPGRTAGQIRRALPFVVEEFVTTDIERMHLAHGEIRRGAPVRCSLVERTLLEDWLACLAELHVHPGFLLPETELLPVAAGQVSVLFDGDLALVRTPDQSATVDRDNLAIALNALPAERLLLINGDLAPLERARLDPGVAITHMETSGLAADSTLGFLAAQAEARRSAVNLLQGAYRPRQQASPYWLQWRAAAALAAVWVVVALASNVIEALHASRQADRLEAESVALYRDIYPGTTRITNVRRQMQAAMGERAGTGAGLIDNLGHLAAAVTADSSIQSLNYALDRGELAVDLFIPGYEELDQLKERLVTRGVQVDIASAEQQGRGVRARVRVREAGQGA